ncbi:hypothetical protein JHW43_004549 [Diplocarpon mali]|nr:hypothetical protein JHW43_004549 [Diplocarpon mali]
MAGFINRENRVPYYQRLFQEGSKKHVRQWNQTSRSKLILYPYYVALFGGLGGTCLSPAIPPNLDSGMI